MQPKFEFYVDDTLVCSYYVSSDINYFKGISGPAILFSGFIPEDADTYTVTLKNYEGRYPNFEQDMMTIIKAVRESKPVRMDIIAKNGTFLKSKNITSATYGIMTDNNGDIYEFCNVS